MRTLVTGGAGFIGSHLVDALVEKGHEVTVLDNLTTGKLENIAHHIEKGNITFIKGDIQNTRILNKALKNVDAVMHLAALISVEESIKKPLLYHQVNVTGTLKLLKTAAINKVKHIIFASSAAVYGEPIELPIKESHPLNPLSPYAATKIAAENYLKTYNHIHGITTTILRIFNAYGPRQTISQYAGVITKFINNALTGKPLIIYGDGTQTRDFIYVKDVAKAFIAAFEAKRSGTYNIATGKPTTINQLAQLIKQLTKSPSSIIHTKPRKGDIKHSHADTTKAQQELEFKAKTSLKEGLKQTIKQPNIRKLNINNIHLPNHSNVAKT